MCRLATFQRTVIWYLLWDLRVEETLGTALSNCIGFLF